MTRITETSSVHSSDAPFINLPISIACTLLSNKSEGRNIIPVTVLNVSTIQLMTSPEWPFARHALICDAIENILHFTTFEIGTKQSFRINYRSSGNIKLTVRSAKSEVKSFEFNISLMELVPNFGPNKLNIRAMCLFKSLTQHYFPVHYLFRYNSFSRKSYLILKKTQIIPWIPTFGSLKSIYQDSWFKR